MKYLHYYEAITQGRNSTLVAIESPYENPDEQRDYVRITENGGFPWYEIVHIKFVETTQGPGRAPDQNYKMQIRPQSNQEL